MEIRLKTRNNLIELIKKATVDKVVSSQELIDYIMTLQTDQHCGICIKNKEGVCRVVPFLPVPECYPKNISGIEKECVSFECKNGCGYQEPYGFVPMAGCPIHD